MDDLIDDLTKIPLSGDDLISISNKLGKPKNEMAWITYSKLNDLSYTSEGNSLNDLFRGKINSVFILIQPEGQNIGHWVTLINNKKHGLQYYDPYAISIRDDAKIAQSDVLIKLLMNHKVDMNKHEHQKFGKNKGDEINTCGRHDSVRAFFSYLNNDEYNDKIIMQLIERKEVKNPDIVVNLLTAFLSDSDNVIEQFFMKDHV